MSSTNWLFTWNNPPADWRDLIATWPRVRFLVCQLEKAPTTNTQHLQGYVILETKSRMTWLKSNFENSLHLEVRKGTHQQAKDYCTKEDTSVEGQVPLIIGEDPCQGKRSDLLAVKADLDAGATMTDIADNHFGAFLRYNRAFYLYKNLKSERRSWITKVHVYYGESGAGKSYRASYEAGPDVFYLPQPNSSSGAVWWDGYEGQASVIIDEFYGWIAHAFMLRLCDRFPMKVQTKGGNVEFLAKDIYITSNKAPEDWWPRTGLGAMERRITDRVHMSLGLMGQHWQPPALPQPEEANSESDIE